MEEVLINLHFESQIEQYLAKKIQKDAYHIIINPFIEDSYWNMGYLVSNQVDMRQMWNAVKEVMQKENRKPIIYVTTNYLDENIQNQINELGLKRIYCDRWLVANVQKEIVVQKAKIPITISEVTKENQDIFIDTVYEVFSGDNPEDPYEALGEGYRKAYQEAFRKEQTGKIKTISYLVMYQEEPVGTATVMYNTCYAIIYSVGTIGKYQKNGICKEMISTILQKMKKLGIEYVVVQTEAGFYTEEIYKKMGFCYLLDGIAYGGEESCL